MSTHRAKNFKCTICTKTFESERNLKRHMARKRPCEPVTGILANAIVAKPAATQNTNENVCHHCGKKYSRPDNLIRHLRTCLAANTVIDPIIRRQLSDQAAAISRLTMILERQLSAPPVRNTLVATFNSMVVNSWSCNRLHIPVQMLKAAFTENQRLVEYCRMTDEQKTDPRIASPYILEALVDLTKRAHAADPASRNIYLNRQRADQVMIFDQEEWHMVALSDAIRDLFDTIIDDITRIILSEERSQLPSDIQASASRIPGMYANMADMYVRDGRIPITAHLSEMERSVKMLSSLSY